MKKILFLEAHVDRVFDLRPEKLPKSKIAPPKEADRIRNVFIPKGIFQTQS